MNTAELRQNLSHFYGTTQYHSYAQFKLTDGVIFLATEAKAFWLLDEIRSHQYDATIRKEPFQVCRLTVNRQREGTLSITDGNEHELVSQDIPYTDFPLSHITLYLTDNVLMLPSEY